MRLGHRACVEHAHELGRIHVLGRQAAMQHVVARGHDLDRETLLVRTPAQRCRSRHHGLVERLGNTSLQLGDLSSSRAHPAEKESLNRRVHGSWTTKDHDLSRPVIFDGIDDARR